MYQIKSEFTGLTKEEINNGKPLKEVLAKLHQKLMEFQQKYQDGVTIIGQAPQNDIVWCKLEKSKHYSKVIDLAEIFKTGKWYYSLRRVAYALLGDTGSMNKQYHDPTEDAKVSMILYREYQGGGSKLHRAKRRLASMGKNYKFPDFRVRTKYKMCSGMYDPKRCTCGQSSARGVDGVDELRELLAKFNLKNEQNEEEKSNDVQNNISG